MNNGQINNLFLESITVESKNMILSSIAKLYGYGESVNEIFDEVTDSEAENILEYMVGAERSAASVLFQKFIAQR